jgi:hypothetical protein
MTGAVPLLSGDAVHLLPFHGQCVITVMGDGQGTPDAATELWTAYAAGRPDAAATGDTPEAALKALRSWWADPAWCPQCARPLR